MKLHINTNAAIKFTNILENLGKAALPMAVRETLSSAAFDVKMKTMPVKAKQQFKQRNKTFFRANSKVEKASGYNINNMESTVGFYPNNAKFNNFAVKELEQQERGGDIAKRSFVPNEEARVGKSKSGNIRANARLSKINKIIDVKYATGKNLKEKYIKSAIHAGKGGFLLSKNTLFKINSIKRLKSGNTVINKVALYNFKKARRVHVDPTHFMKTASNESAAKMEMFYKQNAERTIAKYK